MTDALALPPAFIGLPDWQVIDWLHHNRVGLGGGFLLALGVMFLGLLIWTLVYMRMERER